MPADLIIFDMDGVLTDSERLAVRLVTQVLTDLGYRISELEVEQRFMGVATPVQLNILREECGQDFVDAYIGRLKPTWRAVMEAELAAVPGVEAVLSQLAERGRQRCVASNGSLEHIHSSLALTGLEPHFSLEHRFSGTDRPRPKPAPDLHLHCLAHFAVPAERALVLEDSVTGLSGAVAAGVEAWGFVGAHPRPDEQAAKLRAAGAARIVWDWAELSSELARPGV